VFKLRQRFQAEYHDGQQYDKHGYDGHHPGGLRTFRVLEQQPHLSLELGFWQWFLFFFYKTLFFPENEIKKTKYNNLDDIPIITGSGFVVVFFPLKEIHKTT